MFIIMLKELTKRLKHFLCPSALGQIEYVRDLCLYLKEMSTMFCAMPVGKIASVGEPNQHA